MRVALFSAAAVAVFALTSGSASAQAIHPSCAKMKMKVQCTCALESGGRITPDGKGWRYSSRHSPAYGACAARHGLR